MRKVFKALKAAVLILIGLIVLAVILAFLGEYRQERQWKLEGDRIDQDWRAIVSALLGYKAKYGKNPANVKELLNKENIATLIKPSERYHLLSESKKNNQEENDPLVFYIYDDLAEGNRVIYFNGYTSALDVKTLREKYGFESKRTNLPEFEKIDK